MISTKQLSYALAVGKTLHFKRAAEACNVSQSALSTGLTELEKQLGLQIFERDNKKVLVTPIGKQVLKMASDILLRIEDLQQLGGAQGSPLDFPLSVGIIPTIAPYLLPKIFPLLDKQYPQAKLNIVEEQSHVIVEKVRVGELDTAILALPYPIEGLLALEFWQEDFYWVAPADEQHAGQTEITNHEINQNRLLLLKDGHCLKDHIVDACKLPQASAQHEFGGTSLFTLIQMVQGNQGTTLIPEIALPQLVRGNKKLSAVHLNAPGPHRRLAFIIRPNFTRLNSVEALLEVCKRGIIKNK